ncbi:hypothetical protein SAV31267_047670 [Streptomyces avermitilis]|uniref:Uncharacterized protein n=1 Tax=Streptomyces avermitilis TaxID=33903 RepID=A0A4D4MSY0_STRAX|nr:hypothetical protein SAV31267_047670 [Streptomyces avermitilis]
MLYGIIAATSALLLASALAAVLRVPALRLGLVERRRGRTVSRLGGAAVVVGTVVVAGVGDWSGVARLGTGVGELLVVGAGVGALGLVADLRPVPRVVRLAGQAAAAAAVVPYDELGAGAGLFAAAWIVLVTSAFGSLDQADGVMGTVGVVTAFALGGCAAAEVMDGLAALLSVLAAALTGFLMHNWAPARTVAGRCGALFTGFVLASAAVLVHAGREPLGSAGALFALTAVATADGVLVLAGRLRGGRPGPGAGRRAWRTGCADSGSPRAGRRSSSAPPPSPRPSSGSSSTWGGRGRAPRAGWRVPRGSRSSGCSAFGCPPIGVSHAPRSGHPTGSCPASRRFLACKERIRLESARLRSVDPATWVMHT